MFSKQTTINGVALPPEFEGATITHNVAISADGRKFAVVDKDRHLTTGNIPQDGKLEIGGAIFNVNRLTSTAGSIAGLSMRFFEDDGVSIAVGAAPERRVNITERFAGVKEVIVHATGDGDVTLRVISGPFVEVNGKSMNPPSDSDGRLDLGDFDGVIGLPSTGPSVAIATASGRIRGSIQASGSFRTDSGEIDLSLMKSASLNLATASGDINVRPAYSCVLSGCISSQNGKVNLVGVGSSSTQINTGSGDVLIRLNGEYGGTIETKSGNVDATGGCFEEMRITTVSGSIALLANRDFTGTISTQDGSVKATSQDGNFTGNISAGGSVELAARCITGGFDTKDGALTLHAAKSFKVQIHTGAGSVRGRFSEASSIQAKSESGDFAIVGRNGLTGDIFTDGGAVLISLSGEPVVVIQATTTEGEIELSGWERRGNGCYAPKGKKTRGSLKITSRAGNLSLWHDEY